jgi:large subunit ribosomal protein L7/L12
MQVRPIGTPRVHKLADEIVELTLLEVNDLVEILTERLNLPAPTGLPMGGMMGNMMPGVGGMPPSPNVDGAAPAEVKEEKTEFDLKLESFDKASKIKVIKEIRAVTELGLKEAKELVCRPSFFRGGTRAEAKNSRVVFCVLLGPDWCEFLTYPYPPLPLCPARQQGTHCDFTNLKPYLVDAGGGRADRDQEDGGQGGRGGHHRKARGRGCCGGDGVETATRGEDVRSAYVLECSA